MRSASGKSTRAQACTTESAVLSGSLASLVYLDFRSTCDMRHDGASVIGTDNCVGLPVSDAAFCGDNGRSLIDVDAVRNQPAPRILALPLVVFFAAVTQVKIQ